MTVYYKYLKKEHAHSMLEYGRLRIGTLYEYRDMEKHGSVIGDDAEGKKSAFMEVGTETWSNDTQPNFTRDFFKAIDGGSFTISGITLEKPKESPDFYLYCCTTEYSKDVMEEFGYDACVIIRNPERFFRALSKSLRHKVSSFQGVYECQYRERRVSHERETDAHPAIIKAPKYQNQKEIRAFWTPEKRNVSPIMVQSRKAVRHCVLM